jgi:hypothetical protein
MQFMAGWRFALLADENYVRKMALFCRERFLLGMER